MRIGMVGDTFLPLTGGAEYHILEISRALRKMGYDIAILTAVPGDREVEGFQVTRLPGLDGSSFRTLMHLPFALPRFAKFIQACDVVHCHYSYLFAFLATILARVYHKPSLVTLHGLGTLDSSVRSSAIRRLYRYSSLKLATTVIATSSEMKEVAGRFTPAERIAQIPNGVDTHCFSPQPAPENDGRPPVVLTMRRLVPKNGVQYLVEAAPMIIRDHPDVQFSIVGTDRLEGYLKKRAADLGIAEHFRFVGEVPHDRARDYFAQADVVVFPSSAESTSLACLEAMAMEKAVVASRLTAFKEMLGENERGILVSLFDRESSDYEAAMTLPEDRLKILADAVSGLLRDRDLRLRLGKAARQYTVANYDWSIIASKTGAIYQKVARP